VDVLEIGYEGEIAMTRLKPPSLNPLHLFLAILLFKLVLSTILSSIHKAYAQSRKVGTR
jgi:hypothetical protein